MEKFDEGRVRRVDVNRLRVKRGVTLVELILAGVLLVIIVIPLFSMFTQTAKINAKSAERTNYTYLGMQEVESIMNHYLVVSQSAGIEETLSTMGYKSNQGLYEKKQGAVVYRVTTQLKNGSKFIGLQIIKGSEALNSVEVYLPEK